MYLLNVSFTGEIRTQTEVLSLSLMLAFSEKVSY